MSENPEALIEKFRREHPECDYTFGHVVLADSNVSVGDIHECYNLNNVKLWLQNEIDDATCGYCLMDKIKLHVEVHEFLSELREMMHSEETGGNDD